MSSKSSHELQRTGLKPDDHAQYKRFLEAAREAQAAETEKAANNAFKKVASFKPKPSKRG